MSEEIPFWSALGLGVALTLGIAIAPFPESTIIQSVDGVATVMGVARKTQSVALTESDEVTAAPLVSAAYALTAASPLEVPVTLSFDPSGLGVDADVVSVYRWSDATMMWEVVSENVDVATTDLGLYALGLTPVVEAPVFLSTYDDLRARAPMGARGYTIDVGYRMSDGPMIFLPNVGEQGGCGGVFGNGDHEERSTSTASAMTMVDDVQTLVTYHFVARWSVEENGEACVLQYAH